MKFHLNLYLIVGIFAIAMNLIVGSVISVHDGFIQTAQCLLSGIGIFFCVMGFFEQKDRACSKQE